MQDKTDQQTLFSRMFSSLVWSLVALKLVIFSSFLILVSQTGLSHAKSTDTKPPIVCTGKNLLIDLENNDPEAYARILASAGDTLNGSSKFWKVEKKGLAPSWLLGTMHFADPRVVKIPPVIEAAYKGAKTVIVENTQILDKEKVKAAMAGLRSMMFFTDGSTLEDRLGKDTIALIKKRLKGRPIPYFLGKRMQPWVLSTALVIPLCEIERKKRDIKVLDFILASRAQKEGKELVGLESIREQIGAMASLSLEFHLKSLAETVKLGSKVDDMMETMVQLYARGEIGKFWPLMKYLSPGTANGPGYAKFQEVLITKRNKVMVERSLDHFAKGNVFMAVGALHLPGKKGIVKLLQDQGYKLTPAL